MGISRKDALDCFASDDLIGIGMEADAVRRQLHPEGVVTYTIDGSIDYGKPANGADFEPIHNQISSLVALGGTGVTLYGQITPPHTIAWFDALFRSIKQRFPNLWLHCLSASEIIALSGTPEKQYLTQSLNYATQDSTQSPAMTRVFSTMQYNAKALTYTPTIGSPCIVSPTNSEYRRLPR